MIANNLSKFKKAAALHAVDYVRDGMVVGLGTGSTAEFALRELAVRVNNGLRIIGVPTSHRTAIRARQLNIPTATLEEQPRLHLTIDGADEIDLSTLTLIKGLGGALLHEKIVALASDLVIFIVDYTKIVDTLGQRTPLPVEIVTFGWSRTCAALADLGCQPSRRTLTASHPGKDPQPYKTDSGNYLIDCKFPLIQDPSALAASIKSITGVVEHGIFADIPSRIIVASPSGITNYQLQITN